MSSTQKSVTGDEVGVSSTFSSETKQDEILNKLKQLNGRDLLGRLTYEVTKKNFVTWENFLRIILRQYGIVDWITTNHTPKIRRRQI